MKLWRNLALAVIALVVVYVVAYLATFGFDNQLARFVRAPFRAVVLTGLQKRANPVKSVVGAGAVTRSWRRVAVRRVSSRWLRPVLWLP